MPASGHPRADGFEKMTLIAAARIGSPTICSARAEIILKA